MRSEIEIARYDTVAFKMTRLVFRETKIGRKEGLISVWNNVRS